MDAVEDQLCRIRTEWNVLQEKWFQGEPVDPVFEGIVRDFCVFDVTMQDIYRKVEAFMKGIDGLCEGLVQLSETCIAGLSHVDDPLIKSDSCKMREATNQITRADAPHSAIAKLRRDMDFNIMNPMRNHIINNRNLKNQLERRRRRLLELHVAKKQYEECVKKNLSRTDRRFLNAQSALESAKMTFHEVDKKIFEWLYILEEYKGDILDSALQTLKYLQYEFFATSSHAISGVLPARMEFRPMVEMTPEHLEAQVEMELQEAEENDEDGSEVVTDFSVRLIEKLAKDNKSKAGEGVDSCAGEAPALPVDPLSLSSLLSQGFEEGPARQALRKHQNNTQAALDWLVGGGEEQEKAPEDGVRMPTTVKRVLRLKAKRRAQLEQRRKQETEEEEEKETEQPAASASDAPRGWQDAAERQPAPTPAPPAEPADLLGFDSAPPPQPPPQAGAAGPSNLLDLDEPPPPTDFSKQIPTMPLPPQLSFDASKCEKQPLPASVAAGTAQMREVSGSQANAQDVTLQSLDPLAQ
mmetsp:Transcript_61448/g.179628  ORF Transcript_61448/g.179628 Transcript_61448/m.179628 type:complete len:524 (+) Transcript_61448:54-1625(+)